MIRGQNFAPNERVTLEIWASAGGKTARATKSTRTGARGSFTTTLPSVRVGGACRHLEIAATGATGDHAVYKPRPQCGTPPTG